MRDIPDDVRQELRKPHGAGGILDLWEIQADVNTMATTLLRLVNNAVAGEVTYDGKTYYPFPIARGEIEEDSEFGLPTLPLSISNYTREFAHRLEQGLGFMGQPVTLTRVHVDHLDTGDHASVIHWVTKTARVRHAAIAFELGFEENWNEARVPDERFQRDRCGTRYKGPGCVYEGNLASCKKTLDDCIAHGDDEVARGRPRMHPLQFHGFIGIPEFTR